VLLVIDEWAVVAQQGPVLDLLARHGPAVGISILAATTRVDDVDIEHWVSLFSTRLVLQTPDEASSVRLLGEAGAEDLDAVGQLWPWVQGRLLHCVRGFRMPSVHLADLVERMRERTEDEPKPTPDSLFDVGDDALVEQPACDGSADELAEHDLSVAQESSERIPHPSIGFRCPNGSETSISASPLAPHAAAPTMTSTPATPTDPTAHQLALIGAVALAREADSSTEPAVLKTEAADPPVELYLFGDQSSLVRNHDVASRCPAALSKYRQAWSLFLAVAALPATKASATTVGSLVWPASSDDVDAMSNRLRSNLANARQILRSAGLSDAEARRVVRTEGGMCLLDRVRVDVWDFLDAQREGNRAWAAGDQAAAWAAYQRARALYAGTLLDKQDATHPWIHERVADGLTLRESYHSQWRQVTERVAELLVDANHHAEAARLYRELLLDPFALPSRGKDVAEAREAHARALFGCCRAIGDTAALDQALGDLKLALERDDVEGAAPSRTHPSPATMQALAEAREMLRSQGKDGAAVADE